MIRKPAPAVTAAHRAVAAAGMTVVAYSPGAGKSGTGRYVGRHRATCDVPPSERRRALVPFLRLAALLVALAAVMALLPTTAPATPRAAAPAALTLADPHGWTPAAALDTAQVEAPDTWPLGASLAAAAETAYVADDIAAETAWAASLLDAGWVAVGDVADHPGCYILVGDTSSIACADGWEDAS